MRTKLLWMLPVILISFSGCKSLKTLTSGGSGWKAVEKRALEERLDFTTVNLSGKAKVNFPDGGFNNLGASYRISIIKDSVIMIRVIKLIEAARILITQDSIYVQNRIGNQLIVCDFSIAEEAIGLPADFGLIQDLLLGQYHPIPAKMVPVQKRGNPKTFQGDAAGMNFTYSLDSDLAKPVQILANDPTAGRSVSFAYSDFQKSDYGIYPNDGDIEVTGAEELSVTFAHRKVSFSEDRSLASFDVPSGYTRIPCE